MDEIIHTFVRETHFKVTILDTVPGRLAQLLENIRWDVKFGEFNYSTRVTPAGTYRIELTHTKLQ